MGHMCMEFAHHFLLRASPDQSFLSWESKLGSCLCCSLSNIPDQTKLKNIISYMCIGSLNNCKWIWFHITFHSFGMVKPSYVNSLMASLNVPWRGGTNLITLLTTFHEYFIFCMSYQSRASPNFFEAAISFCSDSVVYQPHQHFKIFTYKIAIES